MKTNSVIGAFLLVIGLIALVYGGITYTTDEKVLDIGSLEVQVEKERNFPLSPLLGVVALVAGGFMVYGGSKK